MFATKSNKTNIKHKNLFLPQPSPLHKHISKNSNAQKPAAKQHQNHSCEIFGNIFRQYPLRRCRVLFPPGWWWKRQKTQTSWEKNMINSGYWRCVAWCSFKKSDWLACLAATFVMHLCVRLWFGDSYWSNLSCEMGESWLASWCLVGKRLTIAGEAIVMLLIWTIHPCIWWNIKTFLKTSVESFMDQLDVKLFKMGMASLKTWNQYEMVKGSICRSLVSLFDTCVWCVVIFVRLRSWTCTVMGKL